MKGTSSAKYQTDRLERIRNGLPGRTVPFKRPPAVRRFFREYMRAYRASKNGQSDSLQKTGT